MGAYKNRIDQPGKIEWSQFSIKMLGVNLVILSLITPIGTKKVKLIKKIISGTEFQILLTGQIYTIPR